MAMPIKLTFADAGDASTNDMVAVFSNYGIEE